MVITERQVYTISMHYRLYSTGNILINIIKIPILPGQYFYLIDNFKRINERQVCIISICETDIILINIFGTMQANC